MSIKEKLKQIDMIRILYGKSLRLLFPVLTWISPTLNTKVCYKLIFKRSFPADDPITLNEKVLWLKLNRYMRDPLVIQCADKYEVRKYVESCGCGEILNELYAVFDSVDDIVWDELPNQFVLKWNFGAGRNVICTDKTQMNEREVLYQMRKWGKEKCWLQHSEMQYKYIKKKIICERLIDVHGGEE